MGDWDDPEKLKVRVHRVGTSWHVNCAECENGDLLRMMAPWAVASDQRTAMMLAGWHSAEHRARRCDYCKRSDPLPLLKILDKHHANYDGDLYEFSDGQPRRIGQAITV